MRKKLLIVILLLVCFWHFDVKALGEGMTDAVAPVEIANEEALNGGENNNHEEEGNALINNNEAIILNKASPHSNTTEGATLTLSAEPVVPGEGETPALPAGPTTPGEGEVPALPAEPMTPGEGETPALPVEPTTPGEGEVPALPVEPTTPGEGEVPALPAEPVVPGEGETPALPVEPTTPGEGETPALPTEPTTPGEGEPPASQTAGSDGQSSGEVYTDGESGLRLMAAPGNGGSNEELSQDSNPQAALLGATDVTYNYQTQSKRENSIEDMLKVLLASNGTISVDSISNVVYVDSENTNNEFLTLGSSSVTPTKMFSTPVGITFQATVTTTDSEGNSTTTTETYTINVTSVPAHDKSLTPNPGYDDNGNIIYVDDEGNTCNPETNPNCHVKGDGTYNLALSVTGEAELDEEKKGGANILVVFDLSSSMIKRYVIDSKGVFGNLTKQYQLGLNSNNVTDPPSDNNNSENNAYMYLYKRDGDNFIKLDPVLDADYTGEVWYKINGNYSENDGSNSNSDNFRQYTVVDDNGNPLRYSAKRADKAEQVLYNFINDLFDYPNIQLSVVGFSRGGYGTFVIQDWVDNDEVNLETLPLSKTGLIDSYQLKNKYPNAYISGTNYEAALTVAQNQLNNLQNPNNYSTHVVFITDGQPSQSGSNNSNNVSSTTPTTRYNYYYAALDEAIKMLLDGYTFYGIYAYGDEHNYVDDLVYNAYMGHLDDNGKAVEARTGADGTASSISDRYFRAEKADEFEAAIDSIFNNIVNSMGVSQTQINDGTTNSVVATSGGVAGGLLDVDDKSFEYWLSWKVDSTTKKFNKYFDSNDAVYEVTATVSGNNVILTWTDNEDVEHTATYEGTINGDTIKIKWGEYNASNPSITGTDTDFYKAAPVAKYVNSNVSWNLSSLRVLLDGFVYEVTFDVWPSQTTLDIQADLANETIKYSDLDPSVRQYLDANGNLRTNTAATLSYEDTRTEEQEIDNEVSYINPDPVATQKTEQLIVSKEWIGYNSSEIPGEITIDIERDGVAQYDVYLHASTNPDENWKDVVYISVGIMTVKDGVVTMKTTGHDYKFSEHISSTIPNSHKWELVAPVLHPMMINNDLTILVKEDAELNPDKVHPTAMTGDYYKDANGTKWYRIPITNADGSIEYFYYYEDNAVASLTAKNYRKSHLYIQKEISSKSDTPYPDELFEFTLDFNTNNEEENEIWFDIYDTINGVIVTNPNSGDPYIVAPEGVTLYEEEGNTGYYYIKSSSVSGLKFYLKAGWSFGIVNTPTGSTYTIVETNSGSYKLVELESSYKDDKSDVKVYTTQDEDQTHSTSLEDRTITGVIDEPLKEYLAVFTNEYKNIDIEVKKVWSDAENKDGFRPTSVQVQLLKDGKVIDTQTLDSSNSWKYKWSNLAKYDDGVEIVYTVNEVKTSVITGEDTETTYAIAITGSVADGFTVTNTHTPVPTSVSVKKVWEDVQNKDGFRPGSVQIQLLKDGEVEDTQTLDSSNGWKHTWEDLVKYTADVNGLPALIVYTVDEVKTAVITGTDTETTYAIAITGSVANGFTVTNTHTPVPTSVSVEKVWSDEENKDGFRPTSVQVQLYADDEEYGDPVTLDSNNEWKHTWEDLVKYTADVNGLPICNSNNRKCSRWLYSNEYTYTSTNKCKCKKGLGRC